jgi:L-glutamine-phosphate cytidylyltransferase
VSVLASELVVIPAAGSSRRMGALTANKPKSLLRVSGRSILELSLDVLANAGFRQAVIVLGYQGRAIADAIGTEHETLRIQYAVNEAFATTEHGYSLHCARDAWARRAEAGIVMLDADSLYEPRLLQRVMNAPQDNVIAVDSSFAAVETEEELVCARNAQITSLLRARSTGLADYAGGFVGVNRFSAAYCAAMFDFMEDLFSKEGRSFKYERVFDLMVRKLGWCLSAVDCAGLNWLNVNYPDDLTVAEPIAQSMMRASRQMSV